MTNPLLQFAGAIEKQYIGVRFSVENISAPLALVYLSYTMCADACPIALSKMSQVVTRLGRDKARLKE